MKNKHINPQKHNEILKSRKLNLNQLLAQHFNKNSNTLITNNTKTK